MPVINLDLLKAHVRADDFADDDEYLMHLRDTAEEYVRNATNRTEAELIALGGGDYPKTLKHAMLLIAAHWYNQRESVSNVQMYVVPDALQALIKPYRKLSDIQ